MRELARGAEAVLTAVSWEGVRAVRKERVAKGYRLAALDQKLRAERTALEAGLLARAKRAGVAVPRLLSVEPMALTLERIAGPRAKDVLGGAEGSAIARALGAELGRLHAAGIAHGDMTTSNVLWHGGRAWLIDFGLGKGAARAEDFAIDLHVLKEALTAAHAPVAKERWAQALRGYARFSGARAVRAQLEKVEKRRRYGG